MDSPLISVQENWGHFTYCYVTEPEPDAVERLTRSELSLYHTPPGDLVESECDVYGEPVSWLSLDEIDALVYGG